MPVEVGAIIRAFQTGEVRDAEDPKEIANAASALGNALIRAWSQARDDVVDEAHGAFEKAAAYPEFGYSRVLNQAPSFGGMGLVLRALARARVASRREESDVLVRIIVSVYARSPNDRGAIRSILGNCLGMVPREEEDPSELIRVVLLCVTRIIQLTKRVSSAPLPAVERVANQALLESLLLPLHETQGKLRDSPTESLLGAFHKELAECTRCACSDDPVLYELAINGVLSRHPSAYEGNSPKEILMLHEIEYLVKGAAFSMYNALLSLPVRQSIVQRLTICATSPNSAISERAINALRNIFASLDSSEDNHRISRVCSAALAKVYQEHWSLSVRTRAGEALLQVFQDTSRLDSATLHVREDVARDTAAQKAKQTTIAALPPPKHFSSMNVIRDALEPFASGAFGRVWRARSVAIGRPRAEWPLIALKEIDDPDMASAEIDVMRRVGAHPNIVELLGVFQVSKGRTSLVMELIPNGRDLHGQVVHSGVLSVASARFMTGEMISALRHIHEKGFAFGDVKPENVLLSATNHVKLCDFGSAVELASSSSATLVGGTMEYMPPEQSVSDKGDWWSLGCCLHFMLTGKPPVYFEASEGEGDLRTAHVRSVQFSTASNSAIEDPDARACIKYMCAKEVMQRPGKDGGEADLAFLALIRPLDTLHQREPPPLSPYNASKASVVQEPWQRRTMSVMYAPSSFSNATTGASSSMQSEEGDTGIELPLEGLGARWGGPKIGSLMEALPSSELGAIPTKRVLSSKPEPAKQQQRVPQRVKSASERYTVAGIDLTSG